MEIYWIAWEHWSEWEYDKLYYIAFNKCILSIRQIYIVKSALIDLSSF